MKRIFQIFLLTFSYQILLSSSFAFASLVPLEPDQIRMRYNSLDGSIWEKCEVRAANQEHDFEAICGRYRFVSHIVFRIWGPSHGMPAESQTYDLLIIADRHELNTPSATAIQTLWLDVSSGGKVNRLVSDVSFDNGNSLLHIEIDLTTASILGLYSASISDR